MISDVQTSSYMNKIKMHVYAFKYSRNFAFIHLGFKTYVIYRGFTLRLIRSESEDQISWNHFFLHF